MLLDVASLATISPAVPLPYGVTRSIVGTVAVIPIYVESCGSY